MNVNIQLTSDSQEDMNILKAIANLQFTAPAVATTVAAPVSTAPVVVIPISRNKKEVAPTTVVVVAPAVVAPTTVVEPVKEVVVTEVATPSPVEPAPAAATAEKVTVEMLRKLGQELSLGGKVVALKAVMAEFKITNFTQLKEEDYPAFYAKASAL